MSLNTQEVRLQANRRSGFFECDSPRGAGKHCDERGLMGYELGAKCRRQPAARAAIPQAVPIDLESDAASSTNVEEGRGGGHSTPSSSLSSGGDACSAVPAPRLPFQFCVFCGGFSWIPGFTSYSGLGCCPRCPGRRGAASSGRR